MMDYFTVGCSWCKPLDRYVRPP